MSIKQLEEIVSNNDQKLVDKLTQIIEKNISKLEKIDGGNKYKIHIKKQIINYVNIMFAEDTYLIVHPSNNIIEMKIYNDRHNTEKRILFINDEEITKSLVKIINKTQTKQEELEQKLKRQNAILSLLDKY